jgi:hypothetical protein
MSLLIFIALCLLAAWVADERARAIAMDVRDAIDAVMTRKEAADLMRLANEQQLSEQLSCVKPLNLFRLASLPEAFWDAFQERMAARRGATYLTPSVVVLLKGAAALGHRPMLKLGAPAERQSA